MCFIVKKLITTRCVSTFSPEVCHHKFGVLNVAEQSIKLEKSVENILKQHLQSCNDPNIWLIEGNGSEKNVDLQQIVGLNLDSNVFVYFNQEQNFVIHEIYGIPVRMKFILPRASLLVILANK